MLNEQLLNNILNKLDNILNEIYPEKVNFKEIENYSFFIWKKKLFSYFLKPINIENIITYSDLIGIDNIKSEIYANTLQFIKGFPANNVLLWGEKGCGKSSLIKSIIKEFSKFKLKLIEVKNDDLNSLEELLELLKSLIAYKFIIFIDDISFNYDDNNLKSLKSIIEGGLVSSGNNSLIYATSNRRHMVKEKSITLDEIHEIEAISEKISLSDRFGISLGIYKPDKSLYIKIVKHYADKYNLTNFLNEQDALNWAMKKGGYSGRTAYQYVVSLFKEKC